MNLQEQRQALRNIILDYAKSCCSDDTAEIIQFLASFSADSYTPYYHQINELYEQFEDVLWEMLQEYADDIGQGPLSCIDDMSKRYSGNPCLCMQDIKQWLVWHGLEHVAYQLMTELEYNND